MNSLRNRCPEENMDEIAHSINTITTVVDDGAAGVNNAAISTQVLLRI